MIPHLITTPLLCVKLVSCAGRLDPEDRGCYIDAAIRELREEFKVDKTIFTARIS